MLYWSRSLYHMGPACFTRQHPPPSSTGKHCCSHNITKGPQASPNCHLKIPFYTSMPDSVFPSPTYANFPICQLWFKVKHIYGHKHIHVYCLHKICGNLDSDILLSQHAGIPQDQNSILTTATHRTENIICLIIWFNKTFSDIGQLCKWQ